MKLLLTSFLLSPPLDRRASRYPFWIMLFIMPFRLKYFIWVFLRLTFYWLVNYDLLFKFY